MYCIITLGKPCDRVVASGLVMIRNSSWSVVCVYVALGKSRKAEGCGDRSTINVQC